MIMCMAIFTKDHTRMIRNMELVILSGRVEIHMQVTTNSMSVKAMASCGGLRAVSTLDFGRTVSSVALV